MPRTIAPPLLLLALLSALANAPARAQAPPDCEAATLDGELLTLFLDAPAPGSVSASYEPHCPASIQVIGSAAVGPRFFDFYLTLDSSGSTGSCTGTDIDDDGEIGVDVPLSGCSDPGDTVLAAEVRSFREFVAELDPARSRVAVIQFSNPEGALGVGARQRIVLSLSSDFGLVDLALDEILAAGSEGATDYEGGIELMRTEFATNGDPAGRQQVAYFVSDGVPTYPSGSFAVEDPTDSELAIDAADRAAMDGLVVNTFGVGFIPSMTLDPVVPRRCEVIGPGGVPVEVSTLECIALRTGGEFFASNDPADILELLLLTRPADIESVTVFNDTTGDEVSAVQAPDGGWLAEPVPVRLNEPNELRAVVVATDGTDCEARTDYLPLCYAAGSCSPRTQGYWHRQCLGLGRVPGPRGRPRRHPDWQGDVLVLLMENVTDPLVAALGSERDQTTCEGLDADPPRDKCQKAIKQYTALVLNIAAGFLGPDCELDLSPFGSGLPTDAPAAAELVAELIRDGLAGDASGCRLANDIADWINTGRALR